jgi:phosphoglycolate phosphatase-like HAD superfamily hydrolase
MARASGILLDVDGTLLDSNDAHARSWIEIFARHGREIPFERVRPLIGKGSDKLVPELTGVDPESSAGKAMTEERKALFKRDYLPKLAPTRGARAMVERFKDDGLQVVVATSASGDELEALLRQADVEDLIGKATTSSDAESSKPDPDIVHAALRKGKLRSGQALMIGDTPYDIESAGRASVPCVALRCGGWWSDEALAGAVAIYNDPAQLLDRYEEFCRL